MNKLLLWISTATVFIGCASKPSSTDENTKSFMPTVTYVAPASQRILAQSLRSAKRFDERCPKAVDSSATIKKLVAQANACVLGGQWQQVEAIANGLSQSKMGAPWGPYYLSLSAEARKDYPRAMWMIELALKTAPKEGILLYHQARLQWTTGEFAASVENLKKALQYKPEIIDAHLLLAQVLYRDQDFKLAGRHFDAVLAAEPENLPALVGSAECRLKSGDNGLALQSLTKAVELAPQNLELRVRQATIAENLVKDFKLALNAYVKMKELAKRNKLDAPLSFDVDGKITNLKSLLAKAEAKTRAPAGKTEEVTK